MFGRLSDDVLAVRGGGCVREAGSHWDSKFASLIPGGLGMWMSNVRRSLVKKNIGCGVGGGCVCL